MSLRPGPNALLIGEWIADPCDDSLTRGAEKLRLEPRTMCLLLRLAKSPGEVLSQDTLLNEVWQGVIVSPASVYQTVSQLRKALGDTATPPSYIETVSRKGYRLVATVGPLPAAEKVETPPAVAATRPNPPLDAPAAQAGEQMTAPPMEIVGRASRRGRWAYTIVALFLAVLAGYWFYDADNPPVADSLVVLPIIDLTPGKNDQPFCDGLTEELSNWLAQIPTLRVVARTSAFSFRGREVDVREIGRSLGVSHVLEGSFRRSGNVVRVTMQLIEARDGFHVWSRSFERPIGDILELQDEIARAVATNMERELTLATASRFKDRRTATPQALQAYLLARHHQEPRSKDGNDRAIELYRQALGGDPQFMLAKVGLAEAYLNTNYYDDRPMTEVAALANPLLAEVERRAPQLPDLYVVRGALHTNLHHPEAARSDFEQALKLTPNSSAALAAYARLLLIEGEPREALRMYTDAANLDPLFFNLHAQRCQALTDLADFAGAEAACARARALQPEAPRPLTVSSDLAEARGRPAEALAFTELALRKSGNVAEIQADRCRWLMRVGLVKEARVAYEEAAAASAGKTNLLLAALGLRTAFALHGKKGLEQQVAAGNLDSTDDPELLFELAETSLMAGDESRARRYSDRALSSDRLGNWELGSAWYMRTGRSYQVIAAATEIATGDDKLAEGRLAQVTALIDKLLKNGLRRHGLFLVQADIAALRGDDESAMRALRSAAELGWRNVSAVEAVPYFAALHRRADYRALVAKIRDRNAADAARIVRASHAP